MIYCRNNPFHPAFKIPLRKHRCSWAARIRWANAWVRWRLARCTSVTPQDGRTRPSLKEFLTGSTGVYGVDGKLVVMVRRPPERAAMVDRQLSFNCPRYITVGIIIPCLRFIVPTIPRYIFITSSYKQRKTLVFSSQHSAQDMYI